MPHTIIFIGPQGSGKGTQVGRLALRLRASDPTRPVVDIQTGRRFRALATKQENYTETRVASTIDTGAVQPLFLSVVLWGDAFLHHVSPECHILMDGFPRTLEEATVLESALTFYGRTQISVILLDVAEGEVRSRMKARARKDDTDEAIEARLRSYREQTPPVIDYYKNRAATRFIHIDASRTIEAVAQDIGDAIGV